MDRIAECEASYQSRAAALAEAVQAARRSGRPAGLKKATSNLFRHRRPGARQRLDVRSFDHVLRIDTSAGTFTELLVKLCRFCGTYWFAPRWLSGESAPVYQLVRYWAPLVVCEKFSGARLGG